MIYMKEPMKEPINYDIEGDLLIYQLLLGLPLHEEECGRRYRKENNEIEIQLHEQRMKGLKFAMPLFEDLFEGRVKVVKNVPDNNRPQA